MTLGLAAGSPVDVLKSEDVDLIGLDERQQLSKQDSIDLVRSNFDSSDIHVAFLDIRLDNLPFGVPFVDSNRHRTDGLKIVRIGLSAICVRWLKSKATVCHFKSFYEEQRIFDGNRMS